MIKAIVFDFDGLVVDTESVEFAVFQQIFREYGLELPFERWSLCIGTDQSAFNVYDYLEECLGRTLDREAVRQRRRDIFAERIRDATLLPGVEARLREARELGLAVGLASSSTREWVTGFLERFGISDYFACIRTRENVRKVKPDPELYVQAVQQLGVRPEEAVAFEDSPNGAAAATAAGLFCVVIPNPLTSRLSFGACDLRLNSMADMGLADIVAALQAEQTN